MRKQTLIWTALPNGSNGPLQAGTELKLSVYVSPRLWSDTPQTLENLGDYPDFLNWPAAIQQATFQVEFGSGQTYSAVPDFTPLRLDLWQALFNANSPVVPYVFEDLSGWDIKGDQLSLAHEALKGVYQDIATNPAYGQGTTLPSAGSLAGQAILDAIGRPYVPEPPLPEPPPQRPLVIEGHPPPEVPGPGEPPQQKPGWWDGCLGCLLLPYRIVVYILRLIGLFFQIPFWAVTPAQAKDSMEAVVNFHKPYTEIPEAMPSQQQIEAIYDFHKMISALGDYPLLLKALGLVVDLTVTLAEPLPAGSSTVQVHASLPLQMAASTHVPMKTHYDLAEELFRARPRPTDPEISAGLLRLNQADQFKVVQVDATGGVVKLVNLASNLRLLANPNLKPENTPEETGLPSLRNGGLSLVKPERALKVHLMTIQSYALNLFAANLDASPVQPLAAAEPPPAPTNELYAEDVTRGYRIDVLDDETNQWRSLCRRVGTYDFGNGLLESGWQDEGFVQLGATTKLNPGPTDIEMRVGETLISWDGWSLVAPRPGQVILDEYETPANPGDDPVNKTAYPTNPAVTVFPLSASFQAQPGSLPRLRFGHGYRLRARVVDLAGNSVFDPGDPAFQTTPAESSDSQDYRRFEPVSPPPVVLREVPKEGESLERIVVRSSIHQDATTIAGQTSERHIIPPKAAQIMVEQHGLFDGPSQMNANPAAYELAAREAGTLMEQLNLSTGDLETVPGAQEVVQFRLDPSTNQPELDENGDPIVLGRVWLQANGQFTVTYLPDPFARGVLLLGLPGMSSFDEIIEPNGTIVNKIPFAGAWPNPAPLRIRLQGLKDQQPGPQTPQWDPVDRVLTVELHQGATAEVLISSYFHQDDLDQMGVWRWTEETGTPDLADLRTMAVKGRNWLYQPFRTLFLVHAVQQPLAIPDITSLSSDKRLGNTYTTLSGTIAVDGKSTGKLDLQAGWADPRDDPGDPANDPASDETPQQMYVKEIQLTDPTSNTADIGGPQIEAIRHELGDTRRHIVTYKAPGSTRFREYMEPAVLATPAEMMRPTPAEVGTQAALDAMIEVDIKNSARPAAAGPVHVLPVFPWDESTNGSLVTHTREGGWLRVYLERPWFSSGFGELLGVVIRPEQVDPRSDLAEVLKPYTSQWGNDPVWYSADVMPLQLEHMVNLDEPGHELPLEELKRSNSSDGRVVHVAGYAPQFDPERGLWFCDIAMRPEGLPGQAPSYFPFVRLALARFQPHSTFSDDVLDSAHLSRVVLADYVQLAPDRRVEYDLGDVQANGNITINVSGPVGFRYEKPTVMLVSFARRDPRVPDPADDLGWAEIGKPAALQFQPNSSPELATWKGTLALPSPQPSPLRILVRELELFPGDKEAVVTLPEESDGDQPPTGVSMLELPRMRERMVFADELELP